MASLTTKNIVLDKYQLPVPVPLVDADGVPGDPEEKIYQVCVCIFHSCGRGGNEEESRWMRAKRADMEGMDECYDEAKNYASELLAYIFDGEEGDRDLLISFRRNG